MSDDFLKREVDEQIAFFDEHNLFMTDTQWRLLSAELLKAFTAIYAKGRNAGIEESAAKLQDGRAHCCEDCPCGYWPEQIESLKTPEAKEQEDGK